MLQTFKYISFFIILLLEGCKEKFPVYSSFCDHNSSFHPPCLHYPLMNSHDKRNMEKSLGVLDNPTCPYHLNFILYHIGKCDNPVVKSIGSDFDGYVRIEIFKGFECVYKVQSDFKRDEESAKQRVFEQLQKDITFGNIH